MTPGLALVALWGLAAAPALPLLDRVWPDECAACVDEAERALHTLGRLLVTQRLPEACVLPLTPVVLPGLRAHALFLQAGGCWYARQSERAWTLQSEAALLARGTPLASRIAERRAEWLALEPGKEREAEQALEALSRRALRPGPELRLAQAALLVRQNQEEKARALWRTLAVSEASTAAGREAWALLGAEGQRAVPAQGLLERLEALTRAFREDELDDTDALLCTRLTSLSEDGRARYQLWRAQRAFSRGQTALAMEALGHLGPDAALEHRLAAAALKLRRAVREGRVDDVARMRQEFEATLPGQPVTAEAAFFQAWMPFSAGLWKEAVATLAAARALPALEGRRAELRWLEGYARYKQADDAGAEAALCRFSEAGDAAFSAAASYWCARVVERRDGPVRARPRWESLARTEAGSVYGHLARLRIKPRESSPPAPVLPAPQALPAVWQVPLSLARAGLLSEATLAAMTAVRAPLAVEHRKGVAAQLQQLGLARVARGVLRQVRGVEQERALLFPRPWTALVEAAWSGTPLGPGFAWATMRRESQFDPAAHSPADAWGLMQVLPITAERIAQASGLGDASWSVSVPEWNLRFAAWYHARLYERFRHPALVAAGYNAGPRAVVAWAERRRARCVEATAAAPCVPGPLDEWMEEIPLKETRNYVKGVLADAFTYASLYGPTYFPVDERLLELPADIAPGIDF